MEGRQKSKSLEKKGEILRKTKSHKGLSTVITSLLIIGLSLVAITIIWVVIGEVISTGSEKVEINQFVVDLDLKKVVISENGTNVTVKRNPGKGNISGIKFTISDGTNQYVFDDKTIVNELEEKTFSLNYTGIVKEVSIYPLSKQGASELTGNVADIQEFTAVQSVKNMAGLVSWWRFEGNANDEMARNNGALVGNPQLVNGKYGKAYNFTAGKYVNVSDSPSLRLENSNMSIILWAYVNNLDSDLGVIEKGNATDVLWGDGYALTIMLSYDEFSNPNGLLVKYIITKRMASPTKIMPTNNLFHIAATTNLTSRKVYLNGMLNTTNSQSLITGNTAGKSLTIGYDYYIPMPFNGIIDEVMIFNRTLSSQEVQQLYNLNLDS